MKLSTDVIETRLKNWPVARLATVNPAGIPHQVPIVFVWQTGKIWSPVDGKPKDGAQLARITNALANPTGSILLDEYTDDWSQLWWLRIDVSLEVIRVDEANDQTKRDTAKAIVALESKYPQYRHTPVLTDPPTLLRMTPGAFASWQAS